MNTREFIDKVLFLRDSIFKRAHFTDSEIAQLEVGVAQNMQEQDFKKQELNLMIKKTMIELELTIARERINNLKAGAEAISAIIQAESIKRSVVDNAAINKANAYIGYFNVAMNAIANNSASLNTGSTLGNISELVVDIISKINIESLPNYYDTMLGEYGELAKIESLGLGSKQVGIYTPKNTITINERITIRGISVYGENASYFTINDEVQTTNDNKALFFQRDTSGLYKVSFYAKNNQDEYVSESVYIEVRDEGSDQLPALKAF